MAQPSWFKDPGQRIPGKVLLGPRLSLPELADTSTEPV
jgi:hypothetical protein